MMKINPRQIEGTWDEGYALDLHTLSSSIDDQGRFDNKRSEVGEALNRLKFRKDQSQVQPLASAVSDFLTSESAVDSLDGIVPIPPSDLDRKFQPVIEIARLIGAELDLEVHEDYLIKTKATPSLKAIEDPAKRASILQGVFDVKDRRFAGKSILLLDDVFRSGTTLNMASSVLKSKGKVATIYVVTLTQTRTKR
jgi:competence protein ComFC